MENDEQTPESRVLTEISATRSEWEKEEPNPNFFYLAATRRAVLDVLDRIEKAIRSH